MKDKVNKFKNQEDWDSWVGKAIRKKSDRPFKSGFKLGEVEEITINPYTHNKAFKMVTDGSIVDCHQCKLAEV